VRHMEVFGTACIAYAQQFFIYTNRDSVSRGVYGPVPSPSPGLLACQPGSGAGAQLGEGEEGGNDPTSRMGVDGSTEDDVTMEITATTYPPHHPHQAPHSPTSTSHHPNNIKYPKPKKYKHHLPPPGGGITMPVRIDPEEEKRLSLLRKRVAASEAKREVLETEYLSLRAHYVHESHLLRHARRNTDGQLGLLKELGRRRGEVLALKRVRVEVGREILEVLRWREENGRVGARYGLAKEEGGKDMEVVVATTATNAITTPSTTTTTTKEEATTSDKVPEDLIDIWTTIEARLHEAELACSEVQPPKELFLVKSSLSIARAAAGSTSTGSNTSSSATTSIVTSSSTSSSSDKHAHHPTTANTTNTKTSSSDTATALKTSLSSSTGDIDSIKNPSLSSSSTSQHSSVSSVTHPSQRRSRSPLRSSKEGGGKQHLHDQEMMDNDGSGSVSSYNGSNTTKKKGGGKGVEHSKTDAKGNSTTGNLSSSGTTTSTGGDDYQNASNNTNTNTNHKGSTKSHNKRATTNNNTSTVPEESSPTTEVGDVLMSDGASATVAAITTSNSTNSSSFKTKKKRSSSVSQDDTDDTVIPWSCQAMPRTPYDVSVFISNLSSAPDGSAAFGCGTMFGTDDSSMIWLESNIPKPSTPHTSTQIQSESRKLFRLRREVRDLSETLDQDVRRNRDLQIDLIANRKRSDELSAMISMLRTETEAVLIRHNGILETPEARARAVALLHAKSVGKAEAGDGIEEDGSLGSNSDDEDDLEDDEELDEKDKSSDGGTVIEDEETEEGGRALFDTETGTGLKDIHTDPGDSVEEGEIHEEAVRLVITSDFEDENGGDEEGDEEGFDDAVHQHQPMKEVIVPRLNSGGDGVEGESAVVDEEDGEINESYSTATGFEAGKRCYSEVSDVGSGEAYTTPLSAFSENDPDKKRRRV